MGEWTPLFGDAPDRPAFDRFAPPNWLGAQNRWRMVRPPVHWLLKLWNYDPELRVLPGITAQVYRIARRTRRQIITTAVFGNDHETGRMRREKLLPIVSLIPTIEWNDDFFQWLRDHDTWVHTNAYKDVADCVEEVERAEEDRKQRESDDDGDVRGRAAWRALQLRTGQKVFVHEPSWSLNDSVEGPRLLPTFDDVTEPSDARGPQSGDSNGHQPLECSPGQGASPSGDA